MRGVHRVAEQAPGHGVGFGEALRVWARVAALSFGGPAGQIAVMHRIVVDEKRWLGEARFLHALSFCTLLPGPEAQQLAIYIGWLMHRTPGGLLAGGLFVLPGAVTLMALSAVYAVWGQERGVAGLFFGLKAAVLAVVLQALLRLGRRALRSRAMAGVAAAAFTAIFFFGVNFALIIVAAGILGWAAPAIFAQAGGAAAAPGLAEAESALGEAAPAHALPNAARAWRVAILWLALWLAPVAVIVATLGQGSVFADIAVYFSEMAVVTFGGAYAVLAYVAQEAVQHYHWLRPGEMLDGLGMAETTPGPLIMVVQFVGFMAAYRAPGALPPLVAGMLGGLLTIWVTFTPCFLWIFAGAPFMERLRGHRALAGALSAITAAVVGVILNLTLWFALHCWFRAGIPVRAYGLDFEAPVWASVAPVAVAISGASILAIFRLRIGMLAVLAAAAVTGAVLRGVVGAG